MSTTPTGSRSNLGQLLKPERERRRRKSRQAAASKERHSSLSANSTDQVGEIESGSLSSKLQTAQTTSRALLPPPKSPRSSNLPPTHRESSGTRGPNLRPINLPVPMHLKQPKTTKNQDSQKFTQFFTSTTSGSTQRAIQGNTNSYQSSQPEEVQSNTVSLRQPTEGTTQAVTSPSSAAVPYDLNRSVMTNIVEQCDAEEMGSVSTIYDLTADAKNRSDYHRRMEADEERRALEYGMHRHANDDVVNDDRKGPNPPNISAKNANSNSKAAKQASSATNSFSNIFKKANGLTESSAANESKPWYHFDANSSAN